MKEREPVARTAEVGLALDRTPAAGSGIDGGLALWSLAPRASYESWQATVMGMGRDDASDGSTTLRSALALGARVGGAIEWRGARARVELVQWIPIRLVQQQRSAIGPGPPPSDGAGEPDGTQHGARGGSILRISLGSAPAP